MTPRVMQLTLRANQPKLADARCVRRFWGWSTLTCSPPSARAATTPSRLDQAQIRSPSDPGYVPTAPPALTRAAALGLLEAAGYQIENDTSASVTRRRRRPRRDRDHQRAAGDHPGASARTASSCLWSSASPRTTRHRWPWPTPPPISCAMSVIAATVLALDPVALYRDALVNNTGGRPGRLARSRRKFGDGAGLPLQLPGAGGDGGVDERRPP